VPKEKVLDAGARRGPDPSKIYPIRAPIDTEDRGGRVVLVYPKDFSLLERKLHTIIGGPKVIKRPLDDIGTMLWNMADGKNDLLSIYMAEQKAFRERVEPVDRVVGGLLETMLKLGLMRLEYMDKNIITPKKKATRIITRVPE